jgi:hypothetical protein
MIKTAGKFQALVKWLGKRMIPEAKKIPLPQRFSSLGPKFPAKPGMVVPPAIPSPAWRLGLNRNKTQQLSAFKPQMSPTIQSFLRRQGLA